MTPLDSCENESENPSNQSIVPEQSGPTASPKRSLVDDLDGANSSKREPSARQSTFDIVVKVISSLGIVIAAASLLLAYHSNVVQRRNTVKPLFDLRYPGDPGCEPDSANGGATTFCLRNLGGWAMFLGVANILPGEKTNSDSYPPTSKLDDWRVKDKEIDWCVPGRVEETPRRYSVVKDRELAKFRVSVDANESPCGLILGWVDSDSSAYAQKVQIGPERQVHIGAPSSRRKVADSAIFGIFDAIGLGDHDDSSIPERSLKSDEKLYFVREVKAAKGATNQSTSVDGVATSAAVSSAMQPSSTPTASEPRN